MAIAQHLRATDLAKEPELLGPALGLGMLDATAPFLAASLAGVIASPHRFGRHWPELGVLLVQDGDVVARAFAVAYSSTGGHARTPYPDHGWEAALVWAAEDILDGTTPDTAAAITVTVAPHRRGEGLGEEALRALADASRAQGLARLLCPVRPTGKAAEPKTAMTEYVRRARPDGLPADAWLRVHVRAGGRIAAIAPFAMNVQGTLDQWRKWTGEPFDRDGEVLVTGALATVVCSLSSGWAVYAEPNVWVEYRL